MANVNHGSDAPRRFGLIQSAQGAHDLWIRMIDEVATKAAFGYTSRGLCPFSKRTVIARCDRCNRLLGNKGNGRITLEILTITRKRRGTTNDICRSCAHRALNRGRWAFAKDLDQVRKFLTKLLGKEPEILPSQTELKELGATAQFIHALKNHHGPLWADVGRALGLPVPTAQVPQGYYRNLRDINSLIEHLQPLIDEYQGFLPPREVIRERLGGTVEGYIYEAHGGLEELSRKVGIPLASIHLVTRDGTKVKSYQELIIGNLLCHLRSRGLPPYLYERQLRPDAHFKADFSLRLPYSRRYWDIEVLARDMEESSAEQGPMNRYAENFRRKLKLCYPDENRLTIIPPRLIAEVAKGDAANLLALLEPKLAAFGIAEVRLGRRTIQSCFKNFYRGPYTPLEMLLDKTKRPKSWSSDSDVVTAMLREAYRILRLDGRPLTQTRLFEAQEFDGISLYMACCNAPGLGSLKEACRKVGIPYRDTTGPLELNRLRDQLFMVWDGEGTIDIGLAHGRYKPMYASIQKYVSNHRELGAIGDFIERLRMEYCEARNTRYLPPKQRWIERCKEQIRAFVQRYGEATSLKYTDIALYGRICTCIRKWDLGISPKEFIQSAVKGTPRKGESELSASMGKE